MRKQNCEVCWNAVYANKCWLKIGICKKGNKHAIHTLRAAFINTDSKQSCFLTQELFQCSQSWSRLLPEHGEFYPFFLSFNICNSYCVPSYLLINKQKTHSAIHNPLAITINWVAIITLIELLDNCFTGKKWLSDDVNDLASLENLKTLFDLLKKHGPLFCYSQNICHIITNDNLFEKVRKNLVHGELEVSHAGDSLWLYRQEYCIEVTKTAKIAVKNCRLWRWNFT